MIRVTLSITSEALGDASFELAAGETMTGSLPCIEALIQQAVARAHRTYGINE